MSEKLWIDIKSEEKLAFSKSLLPEYCNGVSAESGTIDVWLDVPVARQVEDVDVGQEAVGGRVEGARPEQGTVVQEIYSKFSVNSRVSLC